MDESYVIKEIKHALALHSENINKRFADMDKRFEDMDKRFDHLEKKVDGIRADLSDTQETTTFLTSKFAEHERKLQNFD